MSHLEDNVVAATFIGLSFIIIFVGIGMIWVTKDRPVVYEVVNNTVVLNNTVVHNWTGLVFDDTKQWLGYPINKQCIGFNINKAGIYSIKGNSMAPSIWPQNRLLTKEYNPAIELTPGTILAANTPYGIVIHRVTSVYHDGFTMQGDNNDKEDEYFYNYGDIQAIICAVQY